MRSPPDAATHDPADAVPPVASGPPDPAVIEASLTDPERFAEIFDRHAGAVHRHLARRVGYAVADDLTAETFLVAFRCRGRFDRAHEDARPWLYGIATNLLRRYRRAEVRGYRALARTGLDPLTDADVDGIVDRVVATSAARRLGAVLAGLPARERDVLLLIAWEDLTYTQVAQALRIPVGTVRSRLHSARTRLRAALADLHLIDPEGLTE